MFTGSEADVHLGVALGWTHKKWSSCVKNQKRHDCLEFWFWNVAKIVGRDRSNMPFDDRISTSFRANWFFDICSDDPIFRMARWLNVWHRNETHQGSSRLNLTSSAGAFFFFFLKSSQEGPHSDAKTDIHRGIENYSLVPSVSLEEKGRTRDREPATSPSPAGHRLLIKALWSSPSPPTCHL